MGPATRWWLQLRCFRQSSGVCKKFRLPVLRLLPLFSEEPSGGDSSDPMHGGDCLADQLQISVMALGLRVAPSAGRNSCLVRQRINQYQPEYIQVL